MSTKRGKRMKRKRSGRKGNYMNDLSGKKTGKASEDWWKGLKKGG